MSSKGSTTERGDRALEGHAIGSHGDAESKSTQDTVVIDLRDTDTLLDLTGTAPTVDLSIVDRADIDTTAWGMYLFSLDSPWAGAALSLEREVFWEEYGNSAQTMAAEYEPYDHLSVMVGLVHHPTGELVGLYRLLCGAVEELKTIHDLARLPEWQWSFEHSTHPHAELLRSGPVIDIATLSVAPRWRRFQRFLPSYLTIAMLPTASALLGGDIWVTVLDHRAARVITSICGFKFAHVAGTPTVAYLDSAASFAGIYNARHFWYDFKSPFPAVDAMVRLRAEDVPGGASFPVLDLTRTRPTIPARVM